MRQKTLSLVPTSLAKSGPPKPPMTSKAVKKAYRATNGQPRMTKEQKQEEYVRQRRLDKDSQEREKKEEAKETARLRAKNARERKAAKYAEERLARRKRGEPEPRKGVRSSQSRISVFARRVAAHLDTIREDEAHHDAGGESVIIAKDDEILDFDESIDSSPADHTKNIVPRNTERSLELEHSELQSRHSPSPTRLSADCRPVSHGPADGKSISLAKQHQAARIPIFTRPNSAFTIDRASAFKYQKAHTEALVTNTENQGVPSSTQVFLVNHIEEFFDNSSSPTSNLDKRIDEFPSDSQVGRDLKDGFSNSSAQQPHRSPSKIRSFRSPDNGTRQMSHQIPGYVEKKEDLQSIDVQASPSITIEQSASQTFSSSGTDSVHYACKANFDYGDDDFRGCSQELLAALEAAEEMYC